jgi:hypothetical protein
VTEGNEWILVEVKGLDSREDLIEVMVAAAVQIETWHPAEEQLPPWASDMEYEDGRP